jgi:putative membrane protein
LALAPEDFHPVGLAVWRHLAVFALSGVLVAEIASIGGSLDLAGIRRLSFLDASYGIVAGLVVAAGWARVFLGDKDAAY